MKQENNTETSITISVSNIAELLGISKKTVYTRIVNQESFPVIRIGKN